MSQDRPLSPDRQADTGPTRILNWAEGRCRSRTACPRSSTKRKSSTSSRRPGCTSGASSSCRNKGSYFTRELRFAQTSVIVVRGKDDVIRALHNICPHRGNKLVWRDDPFQEVQGQAPLFFCRFHGWRYELDGSLIAPTRKDLLLDFDADELPRPADPVRGVGRLHLHQPQSGQYRAAALLPG